MSVGPLLWLSIRSMESALNFSFVSSIGTLPLLPAPVHLLLLPFPPPPLQHGPLCPSKGSDVGREKFVGRKLIADITEQGSSLGSITYKLKFP